jgi:low temperature requirement protein LtrA
MPLIQVIIVLIVVGVLLWLANTMLPMDDKIKKILNAVVLIVVVLWLISLFLPMTAGPWVGRPH